MDPAFGSASAGDRSVVLCSDSERTVEDRSVRPGRLIEGTKVRTRAVYPFRVFSANGGLMSYGSDQSDLFRRGASYVDRILKGAKASELPVQQPTKFEFVINLKAARVFGLEVPAPMLARADEVIE